MKQNAIKLMMGLLLFAVVLGLTGCGGGGSDGGSSTINNSTPASSSSPQAKIAYVKNDDIWTTDEQGTTTANLTNSASYIESYPRYSPDGSKIAYLSNKSGRTELWVMNSNGTGAIQVTNNHTTNPLDQARPAWSSDGVCLYFISISAAPGSGQAWKIKLDGTGLTKLTNLAGANTQDMDIARTGSKATFARGAAFNGYSNKLYVSNTDFTGSTQIQAIDAPHAPTFNNDGTKIAYTDNIGSAYKTHIINADGTGDTVVPNTTSMYTTGWNSTGSKLLVVGAGSIYWINTDGTGKTLITQGEWPTTAQINTQISSTSSAKLVSKADIDSYLTLVGLSELINQQNSNNTLTDAGYEFIIVSNNRNSTYKFDDVWNEIKSVIGSTNTTQEICNFINNGYISGSSDPLITVMHPDARAVTPNTALSATQFILFYRAAGQQVINKSTAKVVNKEVDKSVSKLSDIGRTVFGAATITIFGIGAVLSIGVTGGASIPLVVAGCGIIGGTFTAGTYMLTKQVSSDIFSTADTQNTVNVNKFNSITGNAIAITTPTNLLAPSGVTSTSGNSQATISWSAVSGAMSYNLYYATSSITAARTGATKISNVTSPYSKTSLLNGTQYYFAVTAVNSEGESSNSLVVSATPSTPTPTPVKGVCGSANGVAASLKPTANLCSAGSPTTVAGSGPWSWSCSGSNGGSSDNCQAPLSTPSTPTPPTGCGANYLLSSGAQTNKCPWAYNCGSYFITPIGTYPFNPNDFNSKSDASWQLALDCI